jgi:hypothetical protein
MDQMTDQEELENFLRLYQQHGIEDVLLLSWYNELVQTGDIDIFHPTMSNLSNFLAYWKPPRALFYIPKREGLNMAFWLDPDQKKAYSGLWVTESKRHSVAIYREIQRCYAAAFGEFNVLIGISHKKNLVESHKKLGYTVLGEIPHGWDGDRSVYVVYLTKEDFETSILNPARLAQ